MVRTYPYVLIPAVLCLAGEVTALQAAAQRQDYWDDSYAWGPEETSARLSVTPWATPLHGRTLRVGAIGPSLAVLDAAHLRERLEGDVHFAGLPTRSDAGAAALRDVTERRRLDVAVVCSTPDAPIPQDTAEALAARVERGCGLVIVRYGTPLPAWASALAGAGDPADVAELSRGVVAASTTAPVTHAYATADYRFVDIDFGAERPPAHMLVAGPDTIPPDMDDYLDDSLASIIRALLWAGKRDAAVRIAAIQDARPEGPKEEETPPDLPEEFVENLRDAQFSPPLWPFQVVLSDATPFPLEMKLQIRYPSRDIRSRVSLEHRIARGQRAVEFQAPLGYGEMIVDVWISRRGEVVDWFSRRQRLENWPRIEELSFSTGIIHPNDSVNIRFHVPPNVLRPSPCTAYLRVSDPYGRTVSELFEPIAGDGEWKDLSITFVDLIAAVAKLDLFVVPGEHLALTARHLQNAAHASVTFAVKQPVADQLHIAAKARGQNAPNARLRYRNLRRLGADAVWGTVAAGAFEGSYMEGLAGVVVLSWPEWAAGDAARWERLVRAQVVETADFTPGLYAIEVPESGGNRGIAGDRIAAWRSDLERAFGGVERLNAAWGTSFTAWPEVAPVPEGGGVPPSVAPWMGWQAFIDDEARTVADIARDIVIETVPEARFGPKMPSGDFHQSWWPEHNLYIMPARPLAVARARTHLAEGEFGAVVGLGAEAGGETAQAWLPWAAALNQFQCVFVEDLFDDPESLVLEAVPAPFEEFQRPIAREVDHLRDGAAFLLRHSSPADPSVLLYENPSSLFAESAPWMRPGRVRASKDAAVAFFRSRGAGASVGGLELLQQAPPEGWAAVVLAGATCLSGAELSALDRYTRDGGVLVADYLPGRYDDRGRIRKGAEVYELFGVSIADAARWQGVHDGAADVSVHITHAHGGGRTLLLNHGFDAETDAGDAFHGFFTGWLGASVDSGVNRYLRKDPPPNVDRFAYRYGSAEIVGLLARPADKRRTVYGRFRFPRDVNAYDVLERLPVPGMNRATATLLPGQAALYALLPYEVTRLALETPAVSRRGERLRVAVRVFADSQLPGDHVIAVNLRDPNGRLLRHYRRVFEAHNGEGRTYVPLALNDPTGEYTLTVRDVLTGTEVVRKVGVF